ncbi:MAG: TlpA family protein disulfide reductase [Lachnospiraceae bacterium]
MKSNIKIVLGLLVLIAIITLSTILYNNLSAQYTPDNLMVKTVEESQTNTDNVEVESEPEAILAPDFVMEDSEGNTVNFSDLIGKPIVLNFWASWCPPCKAEMPDFETAYQEMGEDVVFIMLNATDGSRETKELAQAFIEEQGFSFPVYFDTSMDASYTYGISSLPTTLFIDKDGYLITGSIGMISKESLQKGIEMIKEKM